MRRRFVLKLGLSGLAAGGAGLDAWARFAENTPATNQPAGEEALPFDRMAAHIVRALRPGRGERVILRHDPKLMPGLLTEAKRQLEAAGCVVEPLPYSPARGFEEKLARADIYVWLPAGPGAITVPEETAALVRWLDAGRGRQIHFHWGDGTRGVDGANRPHTPAYDRVYLDALDIDYAALDRAMDGAIARLRSGEIHVTTAAGTDIRFRVGDRPFCEQNGDASRERMRSARVRIDREVELPAGAIRVAPLEESANGVIVLPEGGAWGSHDGLQLTFRRGSLVEVRQRSGTEKLAAWEAQSMTEQFREFALGFNPKLVIPQGESWIPYYGYGAGVVRLSLGNNEELGGKVNVGPVRWFFFPDATVRVGDQVLVEDGKLN